MGRPSKNRLALGVALVALVFTATHIIRAELPQAIGTWASLGATPESRIGSAAVALPDGRTIIVGGSVDGVPTDSVVAFDPNTGSFATIGQLLLARIGHTATLLDDGRVLIAGGSSGDLISADLELFDPATGASALAGSMTQPRTGHAAAKLANGSVVIAGGTGTDGVLQSAETYDPETGATTLAALPMLSPRTGASATTLIDGRVLIAGGNNGTQDLASAEIFEPSSQIFEAATTSLSFARSGHAAVLLPHNNSVLIAGGSSNGVPVKTTDLFLPAEFPDPYSYGMGNFRQTGDLITARARAIASPHIEGYAVAMGGGAPEAEVYRFPTIKTDKDDYAPGQQAIITGSGWAPDSEVTLVFQEDPAVHDDYVLHVPTDSDGNLHWDQWSPEQHDIGVRFYLMAKQATANGERRAQITFTDDTSRVRANTNSGVTATITATRYSTSETCIGTSNGLGNFNLTSTAQDITTANVNGESVKLTASASATTPVGFAFSGWTSSATFTVLDALSICVPGTNGNSSDTFTANYATPVSVAVAPSSVAEDGATNLVYTFTRGTTTGTLTVNFSVGGTATFATDYTQSGAATFSASSGTVTFGAGNATATVTVDPTTDTTAEADETVLLTVTAGTGYAVGSPSAATGTITDDDTTVSVAVAPASVLEDGATNLVYTFTRTGVTTGALTVNFSVGGTATFTTDYAQSGAATFSASSGTVTFGAGNATATVTVDPTTDTTVEADETVLLTVTAGGYAVGSPSAATGTITNDDTTVSVAVAPASVLEDGATNLVYTFTRTGVTTGALTVNFSVGGTATFTTDYAQSGAGTFSASSGTVTFGAGNATATVTVDPATDTTVEADETVLLTVTAGTGYAVGSPSAATGTITNDDTTVSVAVAPASVLEDGATNLVYTFTRTGVTTGALTVNFSVGGTATFTTDYAQSGAGTFSASSGTVTFGAGNATATVTVDPATDTTVEADETVLLTVTAGTGYAVGSPSAATGTITNDDTTVSVAVAPASVLEDGATNLVYTFTRTGVTTGALTVNFSVGGTATFTTDYAQSGAATFSASTGTVTFGAGNATATVTVDPTTDTTVEADETVLLTVTAGTGYAVGSPSAATGTITNDDTTVSVAVAPASVLEDGATNLVYTFTRTGVTTGALTVNFSVGGTATFTTDYAQSGAATFSASTGTVTFGAGNVTATVTVDPTTDTTVEADETVLLTVTAGTGYAVGSPSAATGTITNDDQTITFDPLGNKTYGDSDFAVSATASSGLAVTFSSQTPTVCTVASGGDPVHIVSAGLCTIRASQAGDTVYNAAPNVDQSFEIGKADAVITVTGFTGPYDGNAHGASGTAVGVESSPADLNSLLHLGATYTNVPGGTAHWTFDGNGNYNTASGDVAIVINKANAVITVNGFTGPYDGNAHGASGTAVGVESSPADLNSLLHLGATYTNVPGGTAHWTFDGNGNYNAAAGDVAIVINKVNAVITVNGFTGPYDGNAHGASGTAVGVESSPADLNSLLHLGATYTNVPGGTAHWTFDGNGNYNAAAGDVAIVINKVNAVITVNGFTGPYDGNAHGASGTAVGVESSPADLNSLLHLGATYTNVPGGTAHWTFDGNGNYNAAAGDVAIVINKVNAVITVNGFTGPYDGNAHGASGTAVGVESTPADLNSLLHLGATYTNVPGGTAHWTFDGNGNYNAAAGDVAIVINKVNAVITVNGFTGPYDGNAHGASGTAVGVESSPADLNSLLHLGATYTNVPGGTAHWTFDGNGNYNAAAGDVAIVINKVNAVITVNGFTGPYDGNAHGASGTAVGVESTPADLNSLLHLGATYTNVPGGTAHWTFDGNGNYNAAAGDVAIVINKVNAVITVNGFTGPYDGNAHGASGTAVGVESSPADLNSLLHLGATYTNVPGGTAHWTFDGNGNYNAAAGDVAIVINKVNAVITVNGFTGPYDGNAHGASGTAVGVESTPADLNSLLHLGATYTNVPGGTAHWTFDGNGNYNAAAGDVAIVINKVNAVITVNGFTGPYDGNAHGASGTAVGVESSPADLNSLLHLGATYTNVPGGTAHWTFDGNGNYNAAAGDVAIVINKVNAVITVNGFTGPYDGNAHGASGTAVGVESSPADLNSLLHLGATYTNVPGGTAHWTFDGNGNYNAAAGDVAIVINKVNAVITVNGFTGPYDGNAHGASGTAVGVESSPADLNSLLHLGATYTNVPGGTAHWTFDGNGNYNAAAGDVAIVINKVNAVITVNGFTGPYDGNAHGASGTAVGVESSPADLNSLLHLGATYTNVPGGTAHWTFDGNGNYNAAAGDVAIVINKVNAVITVNGFTGPYDGNAHGASGTAVGVESSPADLNSLLHLGATYTNVPGGTAHWTFDGNGNYNAAAGDVAIVINKVNAVITVNGFTGPYDGNAHGASGTAVGVESSPADLNSLLHLGATYTNVPGGTAHWTFDGNGNYNAAAGDVAIVINKVNAVITVNGFTGPYDGNAHGASGTAVGVESSPADLNSLLHLGATYTNVPGGTAHWTFDGNGNYNAAAGDVAIVINKVNAVITVNGFTGPYDGNAHGASGTAVGVESSPADLNSLLHLGATYTNVPGGTAHWTFDGNGNYNAAAGDVAIVINKVNAVITVNGFTGPYDGNAHGASGTAVGVESSPADLNSLLHLGATYTNVPGGTAHWTFDGNGNYNAAAGDVAIVINKVNAVITVNGFTGPYDGNAHGASGTAVGVESSPADLNSLLHLGATYTNVPGGTAHWTFDGNGNYNAAAGDVAIVINKVNAVITVNGFTGPYDGNAHGASGTAVGVESSPADLNSLLHLGATYTNVPGGTAHWTFDGNGNYNAAAGDVAIVINKVNAVITVNGFTGPYDGNAHGASGTAVGVESSPADLNSLLHLGATYTNVPGGTAHWTFDGNGNYNAAAGDVAIVINKANAVITVNGFTGPYDGNAHGASGTAVGVESSPADLNSLLHLGATYTNVPGGTAHWTFDGNGNYNAAAGDVAIVINKVNAVITVNGFTGPYDGNAHGASGTAVGVESSPADLNSLLHLGATYTNVPGGTAHWTFDGNGNYNAAAGDVAIVINKVNAVITVNGFTGPYDGNAHGASGTAVGVESSPADLNSLLHLGATYTNVPGGTAHWTFDGNGNYNAAAGDVAIVINKVNAVITVNGFTGPYDGNAHGASGTAVGVESSPADLNSLLHLGATYTNVPGGTAHWTFDGNGNYNAAAGDVAIVINKVNAVITVNGFTGPYDGNAHGASGTAVGVESTPADLNSLLHLGATYTNVPGGTAHWTFDGNGNYNAAAGDVAIVINKVNAVITVNGFTGPYDGNAHGASGTAVGVESSPADLNSLLHLGATYTNVPGGTAHWTFDGNGNYNTASGDVAIVINKANATFTVTSYDVPYDGLQHTAGVSTITGVHGESGSAVGTVDVSHTAHTNAGTYASDYWFFTGTANYNSIGNTTIADEIDKVNATVAVMPYNVQWDGNPHTAAYTITGVHGETGPAVGTVDVSHTTHTDIGTYSTDYWTFTGTPNYNHITTHQTITDVITTAYCFNGFLSPIGGSVETSNGGSFGDPLRAFKLGSTIPIKFILNSWNGSTCGAVVTTGIHTLQATYYSSALDSDPPIDATPTDAATTGNQFRLTSPEWHFNLSTKGTGFKAGTWQLKATLQDGSVHTVWISMKK